MQVFDAGGVARDVAELYEPLAEDEGIAISADIGDGLFVSGNRELLGQALANLVDNALKYGRPPAPQADGGQAPVRIAARRAGDRIELEIADRGPGIAAGDRSRVLDRFVRLEGSRSRPGSGLGLSLATAVTHLHKGELRMEDNAPGLRVVIALPLAPAPSALPPAQTPQLTFAP
jgi:signal transduction histidine kinase